MSESIGPSPSLSAEPDQRLRQLWQQCQRPDAAYDASTCRVRDPDAERQRHNQQADYEEEHALKYWQE